MIHIGIDLGGTKIEIVALDQTGKTLYQNRASTPLRDYAGTIRSIAGLVQSAENTLQDSSPIVGVGTPGALSSVTGLLKNSDSFGGHPIDRDLAASLNRSVIVANDANCFTLSEARDGAATGAEAVFGVILGTGVGGGIVVHGKIVTGVNGIAGEWGHNPLPYPEPDELPGTPCYCGRPGCIETFLSGPGMSQDHKNKTGLDLKSQDIFTLAAEGNELAQTSALRYERRLAKSLAGVINQLDPEVIVLGGGLSNVSRLYQSVPEQWGQFVYSDVVKTRLLSPVHGDASGVRGAAYLTIALR